MFFSSVTAGSLLLEQAVTAVKKIDQIKIDKGIGDREYLVFMEENEDALFYANKIKTTRYFVDGIIPQFDSTPGAFSKILNYISIIIPDFT